MSFFLQFDFSIGAVSGYRSSKRSVKRRQNLLSCGWYRWFHDLCWCEAEIAHSDQVVGRQCEAEHPINSHHPAMAGLTQAADRFEPAEDVASMRVQIMQIIKECG